MLRLMTDQSGFYDEMGDNMQRYGPKVLFPVAKLFQTKPWKSYVTFAVRAIRMQSFMERVAPSQLIDWGFVVSAYSTRQLSDARDKSIALQGVADALAKWRRRWHYFYGLYMENVAYGLLWYAAHKPLQKSPVARAPSWSWMAWDGQVKCLDTERRDYLSILVSAKCCLSSIELTEPAVGDRQPDNFPMFKILEISGMIIATRRSTDSILGDPSWADDASTLQLWSERQPLGWKDRFTIHSHCFRLYSLQTSSRRNDTIGITFFDDFSNVPETFVALIVDREVLDVAGITPDAAEIKNAARRLVGRTAIRRYWMLLLERCGDDSAATYRRLGLAVAIDHKLERSSNHSIPLDRTAKISKLRLI